MFNMFDNTIFIICIWAVIHEWDKRAERRKKKTNYFIFISTDRLNEWLNWFYL